MNTSFEHIEIDTILLQKLGSKQAWHYRVIPYRFQDDVLQLAIDESIDSNKVKNELQLILDDAFELHPITKDQINYGLSKFYRLSNNESVRVSTSDDFLDKIVSKAKELKSSDIHIEPYEEHCIIRYRVDGHLIEKFNLSIQDYFTLLNQIKIKSNLDIAEKRLPQDGRILMKENGNLDLRVSILPTLTGEKVVMRLLGKQAANFDLQKLGFTSNQLSEYKKAISKESGIVLISGPTGSGKTTTLYATLQLLNKKQVNILTIEDPVEYTIEGINQVQVKESIGLDFARALRAFLRQDPNIIMVGEIRDKPTAEMAIRASLTGHLVLSTIHTNSAAGTITRLIDMGIAPFLIADTLNISIAQRLIRKLCEQCKIKTNSREIKDEYIRTTLTHQGIEVIYTPSECSHCHFTGYSGRIAIYELLPINDKICTYIRRNQLMENIEEIDYVPIKDQALQLLKNGITGWQEVSPYLT